MSWFTLRDDPRSSLKTAERLLSRWGFTASAGGTLRVRPVGPILTYTELDALLVRIIGENTDRQMAEIVMDFGTVEWFEVPWTAILARLIDFARQSRTRCRLVALHGQPAAVVAFFSADPVLRLLLHMNEVPAPAGRQDAERTSA